MRAKIQSIKRHFNTVDKVIAPIIEGMGIKPLKIERDHTLYFEKLCVEIIAQQLSGAVARVIFDRFVAQLPRRRVTPNGVLATPEQALRAVGMSWAKVRYVRDLAGQVKSGSLNLKNIIDMQSDEIIIELTKVKGIGAWTAEMFLIFTLGREDVFSRGDLGLRRSLEALYGKRRNKERIVKQWSPFKSYGCLALWHSHDN